LSIIIFLVLELKLVEAKSVPVFDYLALLHGVYKLSYNKLISLKEKGERKDKERGKRKSLPKKKKISFIKNITCSK
jgi:hypothetical protein